MTIYHQLFLVATFIVIFSVSNNFVFNCPAEWKCICRINDNHSVTIYCPTKNFSAIGVKIDMKNKIQVECFNSPKWSDFYVNMTSFFKSKIKTIFFNWCDLPSNDGNFGEITQILGANNIEKLVFQSFMDLSFKLKKYHLNNLDNLKYLILQNNNLTQVDKDLLANVPNLIELNLMSNNLSLVTGFFNYTSKLKKLVLNDNNLRSIKPGMFDNLKNLELLQLWKSNLFELQPGIFDKLVALKKLDISMNHLVIIPEDIFAQLKNLEFIALSYNKFVHLSKDLLRNNKKLRRVVISNNQNMTTLPNGFFSNLTNLNVLLLRQNSLITLPQDVFWGAFKLTEITLSQNRLKSLPKFIFRDSKQLTQLNLNKNELKKLPENIFLNTNQLKILDLSENYITTISKYMFNGLNALEKLNMENNYLTTISSTSLNLLQRLQIVKFSNNYLTLKPMPFDYQDETQLISPFYECISLEELYLANNSISKIFDDWIFTTLKLRVLDLRYNNISFISTYDLQFISNILTVDLTHNKIQHISLRDAELVTMFQEMPRNVTISVGNNPLICDCGLYDFLRYLEGRMHLSVRNYFHIIPGSLTCHSPTWWKNVSVTDLRSTNFTCMLKGTDLDGTCPEECDCALRLEDRTFIIDCSWRNLTRVPNSIKNPEYLRLELDFSNNMLTRMPDLKKLGLQSTRKLYLSHNNISEIFLNELPDSIEVLELHNNSISRMHTDVLKFLKNSVNLTLLTLHENPWKCDCDTIQFLDFIHMKFMKIPNLTQVICYDKYSSISNMTMTDFCPGKYMELIIGVGMVIAFVGLFIGCYYKYQINIKVWLFTHQWCLQFVTEDELDKDKCYDAFISYSHKDQDFVENELVYKLENGLKPFKLCLHYRDWIAGEWIPMQIIQSINKSRRTIVVLSPNFLESIWGRMEFRAAYNQALSEGRTRVILILYGDIGPTDNLDSELKAYINMNTYLKWDDPWFWDKLRYALPHYTF